MAAGSVPELDRLDPAPKVVRLSPGPGAATWDGQVELLRLETRQLFRLLRILTHGVGPRAWELLDFTAPQEEFVQRLLTIVLMSIPDAESETLEFLAVMVRPAGLAGRPRAKLAKAEEERNQRLWDEMNARLVNPPINDTLDLMEAIIVQEAPEFQALAKRLARLVETFTKTGQDKSPAAPVPGNQELAVMEGVTASGPESPESPSAGSSPEYSTSSPPSTDGATGESSGSASPVYDKLLTQSAAAGSETSGSG